MYIVGLTCFGKALSFLQNYKLELYLHVIYIVKTELIYHIYMYYI